MRPDDNSFADMYGSQRSLNLNPIEAMHIENQESIMTNKNTNQQLNSSVKSNNFPAVPNNMNPTQQQMPVKKKSRQYLLAR